VDVNVGVAHEAIAAATPDREALVFGDLRLTWAQVAERSRRLANHLHDAGFGCHVERSELAPWESGQDHLAIYCYNGNEYLEAMLGAFKARVAPFNVNYRYGAEELTAVLADGRARGIVYHSAFAPTVDVVRRALPDLELLLERGWLHPGSVAVADNVRFPGAPAYRSYMRERDDWRTTEHRTHVEYQSLLPDLVLESEYLG